MSAAFFAALPPPADGPYADRGYKVVVSGSVSLALATLAIAGRFTARFICRKRLETNDYLIAVAYVFKLGLDITSFLLVRYGMGRHIVALSLDDVTRYLQVLYTGSFLYAPTVTLIKLSILSLYLSAFPTRWMRRWVWALGAVVTAWGVALCLVGLMQCLPIRKSWAPEVPGTCIDTNAYYFGLQIPNVVTDFVILGLPLKAVYELRLPLTRTLQVGGILSLGLVTCVLDIIRLVVFLQIPPPPAGLDVPWVQVAAAMWTDLEPSIALVCACLPIMRPLLHPRRFWKNAGRERRSSGGSSSGGSMGMSSSGRHGRRAAAAALARPAGGGGRSERAYVLHAVRSKEQQQQQQHAPLRFDAGSDAAGSGGRHPWG